MDNYTIKHELAYQEALPLFKALKNDSPSCLFESTSPSEKHGRLSLLGVDPCLELEGRDDTCTVRILDQRANKYFEVIKNHFEANIIKKEEGLLVIEIPRGEYIGNEEDRIERPNVAQIIRTLLREFFNETKNFAGLYGALAYNFIYQFEDIVQTKENSSNDFHLFLFDTIFFFNHLTKETTLYCTRESREDANNAIDGLMERIILNNQADFPTPNVSEIAVTPNDENFKDYVLQAKELCEKGELMEIVLSRKITGKFEGSPIHLYEKYKEINPSPYMFYFDFIDEYILGASPEIMVRYEDDKATLKPISGTIRRGANAMEDHERIMELLNSEKEKSELDMLVDLGRNDLSRICKPGVEIEHYRTIEKYSHVFHTISQVSGELQDGKTGFDALVSCLNAGTLTGAPKVAAMNYIEQIEDHSRGYYGGTIGYFLFDGDVNTAITIRTAHIKDEQMEYLTGATLLYECQPENELKETQIKAGAFLKALKDFTHESVEV